jgi:mediator of RNA polymerase II transcription subunit 5
MASYALKQTHDDLDAMMTIFHDAILTVPSGGDAQAMHSTIIAMVSSRLEKCFRTLQRRDPSRTDIEPLLQAIKANAHYDRSTYASIRELEQWTNAPNSTLNTALRHTVQQLAQWASTAAINPNPPSYTHRLMYAASSTLGVFWTVRAIIDEVKAQTEIGNGAAALDIGMSIICAPTVEDSPIPVAWIGSSIPAAAPPRTRMNLREMLKHVFDNAAPLVTTDPLGAEAIVRLHRRVEAQLESIGQGNLQPPVINIPNVSMDDMQAQTINDDINKAMEDAANASLTNDLELQNMDKKALEQSMEDLAGTGGLDLSNMGMDAGNNMAGDMNANLGSLPDLDLSDMNSMGMDMEMDMDMNMGGGGDDDWGLDFDNM